MAFEYIPGEDAFHKLDCRVKILFWAVIFFSITAFTDPIFIATLFTGLLFLIRYAGMPITKMTSLFKTVWPILVGWVVIPTLYWHPKGSYILFWAPFLPIFGYGWSVPITVNGLAYGIGVTFKIMCALVLFRTMMCLTPVRDLVIGFTKYKLPPEFGIALATGLGFVPVLIKESITIREALESRGWEYKYVNPIKRMRALYTKMLVPSITCAFRHANDISVAMETRGFSHNIRGRTYMQEPRLTRNDYIAIALILILLAFTIAASRWVLGWAESTFTVSLLEKILWKQFEGLERLL